MATISEEKLKELEATHGEIHIVRGPLDMNGEPKWEVAFRNPRRIEYKMFRKTVGDPSKKDEAQETLAKQIVVSHTLGEFDALLEKWPALADSKGMSDLIIRLTGLDGQDAGK